MTIRFLRFLLEYAPRHRMRAPVHIIGASGRSGSTLSEALLARGQPVVPIVRSPAKFLTTGIAVEPRKADLTDPPALRAALADATHIVSCAHARHAGAILAAAPADAQFVFLGSTRKFTQWPDDHGNGVLAGERAFLTSGRRGVMLHPTMIYGARGEDNVQRLAQVLRKLPIVPLPHGGRALVQPVYQGDVTAAIHAALDRTWTGPESLTIAGPAAVTYADFVRAVARAAGLAPPRIVALPARPLIAAAFVAQALPFLPRVGPAEIRRLLEDKAFDIEPARARLGFSPMPLTGGLARTFGNAHDR